MTISKPVRLVAAFLLLVNPVRSTRKKPTVRLHLVRHGETFGNVAGLACGHWETALTESGTRQARTANKIIGEKDGEKYWRKYASDLSRAKMTAELILGYDKNPGDESELIVDERLREVGKGAREGRDKSLPYSEALELHLLEQQRDRERGLEPVPVPKLESEEEVWDRLKSLLNDMLADVMGEEQSKIASRQEDSASPLIYDVLIVAHGGTIRIAIEELVGSQLPEFLYDKRGDVYRNTGREKRKQSQMRIPNVSLTTIDLIPSEELCASRSPNYESPNKGEESILDQFSTELVKLTSVDHLQEIDSNIK